jgi:hypothetical protein
MGFYFMGYFMNELVMVIIICLILVSFVFIGGYFCFRKEIREEYGQDDVSRMNRFLKQYMEHEKHKGN